MKDLCNCAGFWEKPGWQLFWSSCGAFQVGSQDRVPQIPRQQSSAKEAVGDCLRALDMSCLPMGAMVANARLFCSQIHNKSRLKHKTKSKLNYTQKTILCSPLLNKKQNQTQQHNPNHANNTETSSSGHITPTLLGLL